eukprot:767665-Hanusia_phi.AAC.2
MCRMSLSRRSSRDHDLLTSLHRPVISASDRKPIAGIPKARDCFTADEGALPVYQVDVSIELVHRTELQHSSVRIPKGCAQRTMMEATDSSDDVNLLRPPSPSHKLKSGSKRHTCAFCSESLPSSQDMPLQKKPTSCTASTLSAETPSKDFQLYISYKRICTSHRLHSPDHHRLMIGLKGRTLTGEARTLMSMSCCYDLLFHMFDILECRYLPYQSEFEVHRLGVAGRFHPSLSSPPANCNVAGEKLTPISLADASRWGGDFSFASG